MGSNSCPTVAIQGEPSEDNPSGIVVINESDFDAETMTKAEVLEAPVAPVAPEAPTAPVDTKTAKNVAPWAAK